MKHLFAAVGLAAVTAIAVQGQGTTTTTTTTTTTVNSPSSDLTPQERQKFWSISAALRGFYDDNYTAVPKSVGKLASFGIEVSPSLSLNWQPADTLVGASFVYDWKYYENNSDHDQTYQFNGKLVHNFTPRYRLEVNDSFVISSEPTIIDTTTITSPVKRTLEDNLRNRASILFGAELTPILGSEVGYQNTVYDYKQNVGDMSPVIDNGLNPPQPVLGPSRAGLLNRIEQLITLDLRWKALPETTGILGYQFQLRDFTSGEQLLAVPGSASLNLPSSIRNSDSQFLFIGFDQSVGPNLRASVRFGGQYVDYYNYHTDRLSPYGDANMTYTYLPGSYVQVGVRHEHAATDILGNTTEIVTELQSFPPQRANIVLDQVATSFYAAVTHRITRRLVGSVLGQYQNSSFTGGGAGFSNETENFFLANVNLAYTINPYLLVETGYEYNDLDSHFGRAYSRDRVYLGLRGSY